MVASVPAVKSFLRHLSPLGAVCPSFSLSAGPLGWLGNLSATPPRLEIRPAHYALFPELVFEMPLPLRSSCFPASAGRPSCNSAPSGVPQPRKRVSVTVDSSASSRNAGARESGARPDRHDSPSDWLSRTTSRGGSWRQLGSKPALAQIECAERRGRWPAASPRPPSCCCGSWEPAG